MQTPATLYIVVPCYNEQDALPQTHQRLGQLLADLIAAERIADRSRVLYVSDGSTDGTWPLIEQFCAQAGSRVCGVKLAANAGHQHALLAGLTVAKEHADITVSIDADLQDDPQAIPQMLDHYYNGCDIVYGVRRKRSTDTWFKRTTALAFYRGMHLLGAKTVYNHADYRLMSRRAVEALCNYPERNLFLRGIVPLLGYRSATVEYDRAERQAGKSKYTLGRMLNLAFDGITSFSVRPVRWVFSLGIIFLFVALGILIYVVHALITGDKVPGWASLMLSLWFVGGAVLVGLGIVGEYIGKIYLEVKQRPRFNIEQTLIR